MKRYGGVLQKYICIHRACEQQMEWEWCGNKHERLFFIHKAITKFAQIVVVGANSLVSISRIDDASSVCIGGHHRYWAIFASDFVYDKSVTGDIDVQNDPILMLLWKFFYFREGCTK